MDETGTIWTPEPGIYRNVAPEKYHSCFYASNSRLGYLVPPSTPAHLRAALAEPPKDKKVWKEGRILHACVFEFERYKREYQRAEQCMAVTSKGEQCSRDGVLYTDMGDVVCAQHAKGRGVDETTLIVSVADDTMARACRSALLSHEIAGGFLRAKDAETELTIIWDDEATGVRCKARIDWYSPTMMGGLPMDLKGARDASEEEFTRQAFFNGYLRQSTLYRRALRSVDLPAKTFAGVAIEKVPPFESIVYLIGDEATGPLAAPDADDPFGTYHKNAVFIDRQINGLLRLWDACHKSGVFPGYERRVHTMTTPEWIWSKIDAQTAKIEQALAAVEAAA